MSTLASGGLADAHRLRGIANATDAHSCGVLAALDVPPGPIALDIGAGTGSIARWIAAHGWPESEVIALDQDTTLLAAEPIPANCHIVEVDLRDYAPDPDLFDIVHARFVLSHLADRDQIYARIASWLAPGGFLVITEPLTLGAHSLYPAVNDVLAAYNRHCAAVGLDLRWARTVPGLAHRAGLRVVEVATAAGRLGGGPGVDRWHGLITRVQDELLAADLAADTLTEFADICADPTTYDIPQIIMTTVAQRPG